MIAEIIFLKQRQLTYCLFRSGRGDVNVIGLMLCETYFRNEIDRLIEYLSMPFLFYFYKKRLQVLSVGVGQVQVRYWTEKQKSKSPISYSAYKSYFSANENYDLLKERIENNLGKSFTDSQLIAFHTGETRSYHLKIFQDLKNITLKHQALFDKNKCDVIY